MPRPAPWPSVRTRSRAWPCPLSIPIIFAYVVSLTVAGSGSAPAWFDVLAYLPPTAPLAMPVLVGLGTATWWEFAASVAISIVSTVFVARLAASIYRKAILRTGRRVQLRQLAPDRRWGLGNVSGVSRPGRASVRHRGSASSFAMVYRLATPTAPPAASAFRHHDPGRRPAAVGPPGVQQHSQPDATVGRYLTAWSHGDYLAIPLCGCRPPRRTSSRSMNR